MIVLGVVGAAISGCLFPSFAIIFGEIFAVFTLPPDQLQNQINLYAGLILALGVAAGVGTFMKVRGQLKTLECVILWPVTRFSCQYTQYSFLSSLTM